MRTFLSRSIGARLCAGFALGGLLILVIVAFSAIQQKRLTEAFGNVLSHRVPEIALVSRILGDLEELSQAMGQAFLGNDEAAARDALGAAGKIRGRVGDELQELAKRLDAEASDAMSLKQDIEGLSSKFLVGVVKFVRLTEAGRREDARQLLLQEIEPVRAGLRSSVRAFQTSRIEALSKTGEEVQSWYSASLGALAGLAIFAMLGGALAAYFLTRSITRPLGQAVAACGAVSAGNFDHRIEAEGSDEVSHLLRGMSTMMSALKSYIAEQDEMAAKHAEGFISHQIPVEQFAGAYAEAADKTNKLVQSHVELVRKLTEVAGSYAKGDLSVQMDRLPQEKAAITEAMDTVKNNLTAINAEIKKLVEAASAGDFSARGEE
ncbi:MAG TPA: HAMP domain-containing protein, partial [Burkholderiales bacterium]|nr:HAMP domain-containing protein [Burkholderiales bacterium]